MIIKKEIHMQYDYYNIMEENNKEHTLISNIQYIIYVLYI